MMNKEKKEQELDEHLWKLVMKCVIEKLISRANVSLY
jgi:hypothetical protein